MLEDFAMALPRHVCPVCLKDRAFDEPIINRVISKEAADEVRQFDNAIVGVSVTACKFCKPKLEEDEIFFIEIDPVQLLLMGKDVTFLNMPRTGRVFIGPIELTRNIPKSNFELINSCKFIYVGQNIVEDFFGLES